jgi:hypothetical protein
MDEPRQHDGDLLTHHVRQFRRMARLAAADPLRLLPIDALARLASLSAPAAELIAVAPFDRLRHAVTAPAAAARRETPRTRVQPSASAGSDVLSTAAAAIAAAPQPAGRIEAPPRAQRDPASTPASLPPPGEALRRVAAPATSLADRRAAVRRRTSGAGSSPAAASPLVTQEEAATGPRSASAITAREIGAAARPRNLFSEEHGERLRGLTPVPFDPIPVDRDSGPSMSNDPLVAAGPDGTATRAAFSGDVRTAPASADRSSISTPPVVRNLRDERDLPAAALRSDATDQESATLPRAISSPAAGRWPETARRSQPDPGPGARRRGWEPEGDADPADALFEALYRDGVDLPWP